MRQRRRKRRVNWPRLIICVVFLLTIAIGVAFGARMIVRSRQTTAENWKKLDVAPTGELVAYQDGMLHFTRTDLTYYRSNGSKVWSLPVNTNRVTLHASGPYIAINTAQLLDVVKADGHTVLNYTVDNGNITDLAIGQNYIALCLDKNGAQSVAVIDLSGAMVDEVPFTDQSVLKFGFTGQDYLWTLSLGTATGSAVSQLAIYQPGQSMKCAYSVSDQLIYDAAFGADQVFLFGTTRCLRYNYTGDKLGENMIYGWRAVQSVSSGADVYTAMTMEQVDAGRRESYYVHALKNGENALSYRTGENPLFLGVNGKYVVELEAGRVILTPLNGKRTKELALPSDVKGGFLSTNGAGLFLYDAQACYYLPLP